MTRFADPHRCPDCRTTLAPGSQRCSACGLDLSGELGQRLFTTLTRADELLVELRARSARSRTESPAYAEAPATAGSVVAPTSTLTTGMPDLSGGDAGAGSAAYPAAGGPPAPRPSSVPKVLLGLGATCLLVAALVFLAVTWSVMGVGGRTVTLVALTLVMGGLTALSARHALRGAVEAMGLVTIGLAVLDVVGARTAGWFGDPSDGAFAVLVGSLLVAGSLVATAALVRTPARGFSCGELATAAGAMVLLYGINEGSWGDEHVRALVGTVVLGLLATALWSRAPQDVVLPVAVTGTTVVAVLSWTAQSLTAVFGAAEEPSVAALWGRLGVWPVLAAAAVGVAVALARRVPDLVRVLALTVSVVLVSVALTLPAYDEGQVVLTLTLVAAVLVLAAGVTLAPRPWAYAGLGAIGLGAVPLAITATGYVYGALETYGTTVALAWSGTASTRIDPVRDLDYTLSGLDDPWLLPVVTVTLLVALLAVGRLFPDLQTLPRRHVAVATAGVLSLSVAATVLSYPVPVWTVLAGLLAAAAVATTLGVRRTSRSLTGLGAGLVLVALPLSFADEALTTAALAVTLALTAAVHALSRDRLVEEVAGGAVPFVLAGLVWSAGAAYDVDGPWASLVGLLLLGGLVLGRGFLDRDGSSAPAVAVVEACSGLAALPLVAAGVASATEDLTATWLAVDLTVAGVVATVLALVREDRRPVGWLGGFLLAAASWVRLADLGVHAPEAYTLPSALALLTVGLVHLRRHPGSSTQQALGAGLALALVPSLLWVLMDPISVRAVLLGLACLALVVAGVEGRWSAPLAYGAVVGLLVVLREAGPMVGDSVPRWALIGGAGVLLIALGVTWEARMRDARRAVDYVRSLR